jgi:DNA polymerase/3'-5' exonuclease PolX
MASPPKRAGKKLRNIEIAAIADMLALQSANPFRVRARQRAARTLRRRGVEKIDMISQGEAPSKFAGVVENLAGKIAALAMSGAMEIYERLRRRAPPLAFEPIEAPNLGQRRTHALLDELRPKPGALAGFARAAQQEPCTLRALKRRRETSAEGAIAAPTGARQ